MSSWSSGITSASRTNATEGSHTSLGAKFALQQEIAGFKIWTMWDLFACPCIQVIYPDVWYPWYPTNSSHFSVTLQVQCKWDWTQQKDCMVSQLRPTWCNRSAFVHGWSLWPKVHHRQVRQSPSAEGCTSNNQLNTCARYSNDLPWAMGWTALFLSSGTWVPSN
jgi:hypothetical protein